MKILITAKKNWHDPGYLGGFFFLQCRHLHILHDSPKKTKKVT